MIVNYFLVLTLFFVGAKAEICRSEPCKDLMTAKACNKVSECIADDWSKRIPTRNESDSVCEICLKMVKEARDQLESNVTLDLLKQVFEGSCKLLMLEPIIKECNKLVDQFASELVSILASQMDPQTVCAISHLCGNTNFKYLEESSPPCARCQEFMFAANNLLNVLPKEKVKTQFFSICRELGSYSEACYQFATKYGDDLYDEAFRALENRPCEALKVCPRDAPLSFAPEERVFTSGNFCKHCSPAVEILKKEFSSLRLRRESVCRLLPRFEKLCVAFLRAYDDQMLENFLNTEDFCSSEVCSNAISIWPLLPASSIHTGEKWDESEIEDWVQVLTGPKEIRKPIAFGDPIETPLIWKVGDAQNECQSCKDMFSSLSRYVTTDEDYLKRKLTALCREVFKIGDCDKFVNEQLMYLKDLFVKYTDPNKVCPELVYPCSASSTEVSPAGVSAERSCNFCLKTFQSLIAASRLPSAVENLKESFVATCNAHPVSKRESCKEIMRNFVTSAFGSLGTRYNENDTCTFLQLCSEPPKTVTRTEVAKKESKGSCQMCMMIIQTVYDELKDRSNVEEIRAALEKVCHKMPHWAKDTCSNIVDNYAEVVIRMITQSASPTDVCRALGFCVNKTKPNHPKKLLGHPGETDFMRNKIPCTMCQTVLKMLIQQLEDPKNEDEIRTLLNKVCNYFPEETKDTCRNLIDQYTEDLIDMLVADFNATEICLYLKLCPIHAGSIVLKEEKTFDVETNEVMDRPAENCEFCRLLEKSLKSPEDENKAAEGLLALLVETCMMDPTNGHLGCSRKMKEKILPYGAKAFFNMSNICNDFMICPEEKPQKGIDLLERIHSAVQECAMCESLVRVITRHQEMLNKNYNFPEHAARVCSYMPRRMQEKCKPMLISYGPSIVNLYVDQNVPRDQICFHLKLCDESLQTKVDMPVSDIDQSGIRTPSDCMKGPAFWCASSDNAKQCGTFLHCQEMVWKNGMPPM